MATDVEIKADGAVATLRFVSEGKVNLLSTATLDALGRKIDALGADIKETAALETEVELFGQCFEGPEPAGGLAAFIEKRLPRWRNE